MSCISEITALHEVPGRVRYFVPKIKSSVLNAASMKEHLKRVPGVYHSKTCPELGTLVIYFDGTLLTKESLYEHIHSCQLAEMMTTASPSPASLKINHRTTVKRNPYKNTGANRTLILDLMRHGLLVASGGSSGGLGLGLTALRTLLTVASRAH